MDFIRKMHIEHYYNKAISGRPTTILLKHGEQSEQNRTEQSM